MPSLGADMDEGILLEWMVQPGDTVHRGDIVAAVEPPKSAVEIETFEDGTVQELLVEEGQTVPVGQVLAIIADGTTPPHGRPASADTGPPRTPDGHPVVPAPASRLAAATVGPAPRVPSPLLRHRAQELGVELDSIIGSGKDAAITRRDVEQAAQGRTARRRASPLARRLAEEQGIDLAHIRGTGVGGVVRADDVRAALSGASQAARARPTVGEVEPVPQAASVRDMRGSIAALMSRANREIPHYYLSTTIDMHEALRWMRERNRELDVADRLVPAALMAVATARAARQVPELNGHWLEDRFVPAEEVSLGIILSLRGGGLLVPVVARADRLSVGETMAAIREVTRRARSGRLRGSELATPSITMSNLGDQGVESVLGVIYPPQVALVGFGAVCDRPWSVAGLLGVRPLVTATLAGDHRASDGATGSRFLKVIDMLLQKPEEL